MRNYRPEAVGMRIEDVAPAFYVIAKLQIITNYRMFLHVKNSRKTANLFAT